MSKIKRKEQAKKIFKILKEGYFIVFQTYYIINNK